VFSKGGVIFLFRVRTDFFFNRRLPDHVSLEEGALIEPLSVGIHAARRSHIRAGDRVFIFGAGPVGLLTAAAVKAAGAAHITIAGKKSREEKACELLLNHSRSNGRYHTLTLGVCQNLLHTITSLIGTTSTRRAQHGLCPSHSCKDLGNRILSRCGD
jgi:threonine dehydrogenase-like Zn-dependent dehydrogenase